MATDGKFQFFATCTYMSYGRTMRMVSSRTLLVWFWPLLLIVPGIGMVRIAAGASVSAAQLAGLRDRARRSAPPHERATRGGLVNLALIEPSESGFVSPTSTGGQSELTLDPRLTSSARTLLAQPGLEQASAVMIDVNDGRVLVMAGTSTEQPDAPWLATLPWAPAASVFKVITAAALLEAGVTPQQKVCYHDGVHSVEGHNLVDHKRLDRACNTLGYGVGKSQNAILAKLADRHLVREALGTVAQRFGWNAPLPFEAAASPSMAVLPEGRLPFARVAAGFWSTTLSPLHGAIVAATIARGGTTPPVHVVDRASSATGEAIELPAPESHRVIAEPIARAVGEMMVGTTEWGTAKRGFHDERGRRKLPGVRVAGKTGTLSQAAPYRGYSWFVGYAPAERPEVAVAVLLANGPKTNLRAHRVAAALLQSYFDGDAKAPSLVAAR